MKVREIPLEQIHVKENVRSEADEDLGDLMQSIEQVGLLQPVLVRPLKNRSYQYELVAGHRRYLATKALNLPMIACHISTEITANERTIIQLIENSQRKEMSAFEYVDVFEKLRAADPSLSQAKIARILGKHPSWVAHQYAAVKLGTVLVGRGADPVEMKDLRATTIIGRAQKEGLTTKGARHASDISYQLINSTTVNLRCRDHQVLGRVLAVIDQVREDIRAEDRAERESGT